MIQKMGSEITLNLRVLIQAHDRYVAVTFLMCINCTDTTVARLSVQDDDVNAWVMSRASSSQTFKNTANDLRTSKLLA